LITIEAEAKAAAECEGHASADVGASCTGACHGRCDGTCSGKAGTGGNSAQCDGECEGTCHGECEGHAKVNASARCRARASVKANAEVKCTEPELTVEASARAELDKSKAEMVIRALKNGLPPGAFDPGHSRTRSRSGPERPGAQGELSKLLNLLNNQAMCISGQLAAAVHMNRQDQRQHLGLGRRVSPGQRDRERLRRYLRHGARRSRFAPLAHRDPLV
jgi:hypothetical protein